ncbi:MAG: SAM-dependent methyltransferase, partial [Anaerolineae bacterium]
MTITIVGLGPGDPGNLTREAWDVLAAAGELYLRTANRATAAVLPAGLTLHSFDHLYETLHDLGAVHEAIAEQIVALGRRPNGVVFGVPGHPLIGESSVPRIVERARQEGLTVRLVEGLSLVGPALRLLGIDGLADLQLVDATSLASAHHPHLDPDYPALVGQLYGQRQATRVKLALMNAYPDDHPVTLIRTEGAADSTLATLALDQLDCDQHLDHLATLYVPPLSHTGGMSALQNTVARLRAPGGCPWDREQTHQTLRDDLLEETYEVLEALDAEDDEKLCEELGDLLMQVSMHAQIATESGAFKLPDIIG